MWPLFKLELWYLLLMLQWKTWNYMDLNLEKHELDISFVLFLFTLADFELYVKLIHVFFFHFLFFLSLCKVHFCSSSLVLHFLLFKLIIILGYTHTAFLFVMFLQNCLWITSRRKKKKAPLQLMSFRLYCRSAK